MNNREFALLIALTIGLVSPFSAFACASCGCTLSSDWENIGFSSSSGFKIDLRYDYLNQNQLRSGTGTILGAAASQIVNSNGKQEVYPQAITPLQLLKAITP